jgi:septal ring-binding cell division protein DamX
MDLMVNVKERLIGALIVVWSCTMLAGCGGGSGQTTGGMKQALADYNAQRYDQANQRATSAMGSAANPPDKQQAAYLAGMSAYHLGEYDQAERRWMIAAESSDRATAGGAKAMLGQMRLDQNRPREAAAYLADAADLLEGEDARQAGRRAGMAYRMAGDEQSARRWLGNDVGSQTAVAKSVAPASANASREPVANTSSPAAGAASATGSANAAGGGFLTSGSSNAYALQVGAFTELKRAQKAAADADKVSRREGFGAARTVVRHDERGQAVYIVQIGAFSSREAATAARTKLGRLEYIVAPAAGL